MPTKVTVKWCDPERNWEVVETTVGEGETHVTESSSAITTAAAAERMANYIKAQWDRFERAPGTEPITVEMTPQEFELLGICRVEDIQIGMIATFRLGGVSIRLIDVTGSVEENKLTLTFEVLK